MLPGELERHVIILSVEGRRFALPISVVERVVRAAAVTELPGAPSTVLGLLNVQGEIAPVISLRRRLGLPDREMEVNDQFILAHAGERLVALVADRVEGGVTSVSQVIDSFRDIAPPSDFIRGVVKIDAEMALLQNLELLLRPEERETLDEALSARECDLDQDKTGGTE